MTERKEYFWVGRLAIVLSYCFGCFWICALFTDYQSLLDITAEVYKDGKGKFFGYVLAKIVLPPLFMFSPFIVMSIAEYITGFKFKQPTESPQLLKKYPGWSGFIIMFLAIFIHNLMCEFVDVARDFGNLHGLCFIHLGVSFFSIIFLMMGDDIFAPLN